MGAQTFDASHWRDGTVEITAPWRFQPGDNLAWASPQFDDSQWPLLTTNKDWASQGYKGNFGYAWYRLRLKLPDSNGPLAVDVGHINSADEVYAEGRLIGTIGQMRPKPDWTLQLGSNVVPLPPELNGRSVEIAVRVWKSPVASSYSGGGFHAHPILGTQAALAQTRNFSVDSELIRGAPARLIDLLYIVLGVFSLGMFLMRRQSTQYAWFAASALGRAIVNFTVLVEGLHQGSVTRWHGDVALLSGPIVVAQLLFVWGFIRARPDRILYASMVLACLGGVATCLPYHQVLTLPVGQGINTACGAAMSVLVLIRLVRSARQRNHYARMLLVPLTLLSLVNLIQGVRLAIFWAGLSKTPATLVLYSNPQVIVAWDDLFQFLYLVSVAGALILRFTRSAERDERFSAELEAARSVQKFLLGREASAPGFTVESAYLPAQEVGGDFFQTIAGPDGSLLAVIGDVAGKGLQAAMRVSMLIGVVRTSPEYSPAALLRRLNGVLLQDGSTGFTTCLAARLDAGGTVTIANAGHLSPYINGRELAIDGGLPLGIAAAVDYSEQTFPFAAGDKMLLMSDGVVEARNPTGELFGFERMAQTAAAVSGAASLAATASDFGQDDDITVLLLQRAMTPAV
jgi:hypothetical protein